MLSLSKSMGFLRVLIKINIRLCEFMSIQAVVALLNPNPDKPELKIEN